MQIAGFYNRETPTQSNMLLIFLSCNFSHFFISAPYLHDLVMLKSQFI